jgi:hypothetical protein
MYAGGGGYFDTLLREGRFAKWQSDPAGEPTSFFVIEDEHWQFFGLDSSWKTPSLASAVFGEPKLTDYGGQNGILTDAQAKWMARHRNPAKGCVLMTHHQPASSRTGENQHSDEAVKLLRQHGVYDQIDAWFWGHEHRCVVFKPKAERTSKVLADAPAFCACVGHGGVPVTQENFDTDKTIGDVQWQEGKIDSMSPIYGGERILPFGFARIDTSASALEICIFDHYGNERYRTTFERPVDSAPHAAMTRRSITPKKKGKKSAAQQGRR